MLQEVFELFFICIIFCGVLGLTYFVTKKIGMMNKKMRFNKNIEIIEMLSIMQGHYLYIVRVGESYYLMGCAQKGGMTYLKELDVNQLSLEEVKGTSFQEQFIQFMKGKQVSKDEEKK